MSYVSQSDLKGLIPNTFLVQALDDDGDGEADAGVWDSMVTAVENEINDALSPVCSVPFASPYPAVVKAAALTLALWSLYQRRGFAEKNPWDKPAQGIRTRLAAIGKRESPLPLDMSAHRSGGEVIGEDSKLYDSANRLMA